MIVVGVDIGLSGALAFLDDSGHLLALKDMPVESFTNSTGKDRQRVDLLELCTLLRASYEISEPSIIVFEDIHAFAGQGIVSTGTLLEQKGILKGMATGLGHRIMAVQPKTWQKYFEILPPKDLKDKVKRKKYLKEQSLERARVFYPKAELSKATHHGRSDAILIAKWYVSEYGNFG